MKFLVLAIIIAKCTFAINAKERVEESTTKEAQEKGYNKVNWRKTTTVENDIPIFELIETDSNLDGIFESKFYFIGFIENNVYSYTLVFKDDQLVSIEPSMRNLKTLIKLDDFDKNEKFETIQLIEKGKLIHAYFYFNGAIKAFPRDLKPEGDFYYYDKSLLDFISNQKNN